MNKKIQILNGFIIKIVAMICMTFDHLGLYIVMFAPSSMGGFASQCRHIGRIAFPLFVFLLVEGMFYSKKPKKYISRLAILAGTVLIAHLSVIIFYKIQDQSISLGGNPIIELLCLASMLYFFKLNGKKKLYSLIPIIYILLSFGSSYYETLNRGINVIWFPEFIRADYSLLGLLICLCFYFSRPLTNLIVEKVKPYGLPIDQYSLTSDYRLILNLVSIVLYVSLILVLYLVASMFTFTYHSKTYHLDPFNISWESYCILACIPILLYNGKRGYDKKWWRIFSYSYFPLHLVILCLIFVLIYGL